MFTDGNIGATRNLGLAR